MERRVREASPIVTYLILAANIGVFFLFNASNLRGMPPLSLAFFPEAGQSFPQILTYMFVHANTMHLFGNMLMVFFLGTMVEKLYGAGRYLFIYLAAGVVSALAQSYFTDGPLIGASGAASAILAMFVRHFPNVRLYIYGILPMPAWLFALLMVGLNVLGSITGGIAGSSILEANVAYLAHLAGIICGVVLSLILLPPGKASRKRARQISL